MKLKRLVLIAALVAASLVLPAAPTGAHTACEPYASDPLSYVVETALCIPENQVHNAEHEVASVVNRVEWLLWAAECLVLYYTGYSEFCPPQ